MPDTSTSSYLLDGILDLGERLRVALDGDDLDACLRLAGQRQVLVERLGATPAAARHTARAEALARQHAALEAAAAARHQRLAAEQAALGRLRQARAHYGPAPTRPRFLDADLHG